MSGYYREAECNIEDFITICERSLDASTVPFAIAIEKNIPVYDAHHLPLDDSKISRAIMSEWAHNLKKGSGVVVIKNAQPDHEALDEASSIFENILKEEAQAQNGGGDHFAKTGANGRIWNSLQKLCERSADVFLRYHGSVAIDMAAQAWLGPRYQITAQVNLVHPGGAAQLAHRDYHLGFMTAEEAEAFPSHVHHLSPTLTLQGALAHIDIPIDAGPTKLLPFSQMYKPGYAAWRREDFRRYFEEYHVQLPLKKGDAVFFNPALFHAGGENRTAEVERLVNLFQISSCMGRAMESVNRHKMCDLIYPALLDGELPVARRNAAIAAAAEAYAFPTNLDLDPPMGGLSPRSQADLIHDAMEKGLSLNEWKTINRAYYARREAG